MAIPDATTAVIARTREEVAALHGELMRHGPVGWTDGNVSGRVSGTDPDVASPVHIAGQGGDLITFARESIDRLYDCRGVYGQSTHAQRSDS